MVDGGLIVYGTNWCGDCKRVRNYLDQKEISYTYVDIDLDSAADAFVREINHGYRSVPTIVFADSSTLTEPTIMSLSRKLGINT